MLSTNTIIVTKLPIDIVSLGDNLAEHLNMGNQNSDQGVELLTWLSKSWILDS